MNMERLQELVAEASPAARAERMTDPELLAFLLNHTPLSGASAAAAIDVFRMVCSAVEHKKIEPRPGWAKQEGR